MHVSQRDEHGGKAYWCKVSTFVGALGVCSLFAVPRACPADMVQSAVCHLERIVLLCINAYCILQHFSDHPCIISGTFSPLRLPYRSEQFQ
jgi:hypothetical protein